MIVVEGAVVRWEHRWNSLMMKQIVVVGVGRRCKR